PFPMFPLWHRQCKTVWISAVASGRISGCVSANAILRTEWRTPTRTYTAIYGGTMATLLPERRPTRAVAARARRPQSAPAAHSAPATRHNWFLYAYLFLLPLQNIQTGYLPKLPGGVNFLNIGFLLALLGAWRMRGHLTHWSTVHRWTWLYVFWSVVTLLICYGLHPDSGPDRINELKDSMLGVLLIFVVEMSVNDWFSLK